MAEGKDPEATIVAKAFEQDFLEKSVVREREKSAQAERAKKDPLMRALRNILGDVVLDIFPQPLRDAVDKAYTFWREHPDSFLDTTFASVEEKFDSLTVMRAYADCAGENGYTIRTDAHADPLVLSWRVQNRRGAGEHK
jgi:hypothetical protein